MNWKAAAKTSALLCLLFVVVYGGSNRLTGLRQDVGSFYFAWERHIPFVPAMILPYMSIDLFFIASPFLCRTDRERRTLANRIAAAILISAACWLLLPLRFAFERPPVAGWLGVIFNNFRLLDQPFNQLPSLHITLWAILLDVYTRSTHRASQGRDQNSEHSVPTPESRGMGVSPMQSVLRRYFRLQPHDHVLARLSLRIWFALIALSTVLTYQHHVIDVLGGFALSAWCFYLFQDQPLRLHPKPIEDQSRRPQGPTTRRESTTLQRPEGPTTRRDCGTLHRPEGPLPSGSRGRKATEHETQTPEARRADTVRDAGTEKLLPHTPVVRNPRVGLYYAAGAILIAGLAFASVPWTTLLLWPAASLSLAAAAYFGLGPGIFRKRNGRLPLSTWAVLWPVLLGQQLSLLYYARHCRPWDVLTPHLWIGRQLSGAQARLAIAQGVTAVLDLTGEFSEARPFLAITYHSLPVMDLTAPRPAQLDEAIDFIRRESAAGIVYVHCKVGYSRTAAVSGAYFLSDKTATTVDDAITLLRIARPGIVVRPEAKQALHRFLADHL